MKIAAFYENIKEGANAKGISIEQALSNLKNCGMDMLYIAGFSIMQEWDMLEPILSKLDIAIEGVYDFCDFTGNMPPFVPHTEYRDVIDAAAKVGASNVLIVPGMVNEDNSDLEEVKGKIVEGMTEAVAYGNQKGVKITMEDFDGLNAPYCTIEGLKYFMDNVPGLYCSFDTGNFILYREDEFEAVKVFEDRICTMHIKDRSDSPTYPNDQGKQCADGVNTYPCPVGYGKMQIEKILEYMIRRGYNGNIIAEMYDCDRDHILEAVEKSVRWLADTTSRLL